jgi:hypothetical protein
MGAIHVRAVVLEVSAAASRARAQEGAEDRPIGLA